ncbi:MAG: 30S ribosomal protein S2 [Candidatus Altiarchaeota archaeon]
MDSEEKIDVESSDKLLVSLDEYLSNGVHVGLKYKTSDMRPFIYKIRQDKLCVFDIQKIDERIRIAAKFIASYTPSDVVVVSNRVYGRTPIKKFGEYTGCSVISDRFVSGSLTNPNIRSFVEPKLLVVTDPTADKQAIKEASDMGIPIMAICDTNTRTRNIDFVIPSNNKGKNALALIYWILSREVLRERGVSEFKASLDEFISIAEPQSYILEMQEIQRAKRQKAKRRGRR